LMPSYAERRSVATALKISFETSIMLYQKPPLQSSSIRMSLLVQHRT
jgi:hypothetical protein